MSIRPRATLGLLGVIAGSLGAAGCAAVEPWERGRIASPAMSPRFGDAETTDATRGKTLESRTGIGLSGTAPGGGCGCSQ